LKFSARWQWEELRHKLVLTPEEKCVILFVVAALLLGFGTKCYRESHPRPPGDIDKKYPWRKSATVPASATPEQKRNHVHRRQTSTESRTSSR
jgi:hypothetical protein